MAGLFEALEARTARVGRQVGATAPGHTAWTPGEACGAAAGRRMAVADLSSSLILRAVRGISETSPGEIPTLLGEAILALLTLPLHRSKNQSSGDHKARSTARSK